MLLNFDELVKKYNLQINGVVHVGAHECGEILDYAKHGIRNGILIEANPFRAKNLRTTIESGRYAKECYPSVKYEALPSELAEITSNYDVVNFACYDKDSQTLQFNLSDFDGGVDSLLKINQFGKDSSWAPYSHIKTVEVIGMTLDSILIEFNAPRFNFLNIDVEGAEMLVLIGAINFLKANCDYIMIETQTKRRFEDSCLHSEIVDFLSLFGFKEVEYFDTGKSWGDAFFIKF